MKTRGVTLIEVLIGLSISGILMGMVMVSMTMLGHQRLTSEATVLISDISWVREMAVSQHHSYIMVFDLTNNLYSIYQDSVSSANLVKQQQMTADIHSFQDFDGNDITPTRVTFASFTGTADKDVTIELQHEGSTRDISIFSTSGRGRIGRGRGRTPHGVCFIATAAYGGQNAGERYDMAKPEEVRILEKFRDTYLSANPLGREVEEFYYTVSPPVADYIKKREWAKATARVLLKPVVGIAKQLGE